MSTAYRGCLRPTGDVYGLPGMCSVYRECLRSTGDVFGQTAASVDSANVNRCMSLTGLTYGWYHALCRIKLKIVMFTDKVAIPLRFIIVKPY